jgi:hypothetical protein
MLPARTLAVVSNLNVREIYQTSTTGASWYRDAAGEARVLAEEKLCVA